MIDEPRRITLEDLLSERDAAPGTPGLHIYRNPRTGAEFIAMPYQNWTGRYASPQVHKRKEWERLRVGAAHQRKGKVLVKLTKCSRCQIYIGRGYFQNEVYLEPRLRDHKANAKIDWVVICGLNAVEHELHQGFCLVSAHDWSQVETPEIHRHFETLRVLKEQQIAPAFRRAWHSFIFKRNHTYVDLAQQWKGADRITRHRLWEREILPNWQRYLALYYQAHSADWWKRFDERGYGCSERHHRPAECAISFHPHLFRLELATAFSEFKSVYEPPIATFTDLYLQTQQERAA